MKLPLAQPPRHRGRHSGSAVIVILALLAIILIYVAANLRTLSVLGGELRLLEKQQIQRLKSATQATNAPPAARLGTNTLPPAPNTQP